MSTTAVQSRRWSASKSVKTLRWEHQYVAIYKFSGRAEKLTELKVATGAEIGESEELARVLETLQRDLINKRVYRYANNPTSYFFGFRQYGKDKANEGQSLLDELRQAKTKTEVRACAQALADRYSSTKGVQRGVLIFLISKGAVSQETQWPFVFVFKCDFEDVSQVIPGEVFHRVRDAIVEKTKKGAMYPYFDKGRFDETTVRVFDERGETQYWLDFLDLGDLPSAFVPLPDATFHAWAVARPEQAGKYEEAFKAQPPERSLVGDDRLIEQKDRLSVADTQTLIEAISDGTADREVTLRLDNARVTAPLKEFGHNWVFAEEGGQYYIILRGTKLCNNTKVFNPIDLAEVLDIGEAALLMGLG
jgi:hypothetical protein